MGWFAARGAESPASLQPARSDTGVTTMLRRLGYLLVCASTLAALTLPSAAPAQTATFRVTVAPGNTDYAHSPVRVDIAQALAARGWSGPVEQHMISVREEGGSEDIAWRPAWGYDGEAPGSILFAKTGPGERTYTISVDRRRSPARRLIPVVGLGEPMSYGYTGVVDNCDGSFNSHPDVADWDGDGDLDFFVREGQGGGATWTMHDLYYFENVTEGRGEPLLAKPFRVPVGFTNGDPLLVDWNADGLTDLVAEQHLHVNRGPRGAFNFAEPESLGIPGLQHPAALADWNGDGLFDILYIRSFGGGSPSPSTWLKDLPWSPFTDQGVWRGYDPHSSVEVYYNTGSAGSPVFAGPPDTLNVNGYPIDVSDSKQLGAGDMDGDGDLDLLVGTTHDLYYFPNTGSRTAPVLSRGYPLEVGLIEIYIRPTPCDLDRDGDMDIVLGQEAGDIRWLENTGTLDPAGRPTFVGPPRILRQRDPFINAGSCGPVSINDLNGDGLPDLVMSNSYGEVMMWLSIGDTPWAFEQMQYVRAGGEKIHIQAGASGSIQGPGEARYGYVAPEVADWDQDGFLDLVINDVFGRNRVYRGLEESDEAIVFAPAEPISFASPADVHKPAWNWWDPVGAELVTAWRCRPEILDWDGDDVNDYIIVDHEGYLGFYRGMRTPEGKRIAGLQRIFTDENGQPLLLNDGMCGRSGRQKIAFADWDGDGDLDLFKSRAEPANNRFRQPELEKGTAVFYENLGGNRFADRGEMIPDPDLRLCGHSSCPQPYDFDGDGTLDLLMGAEDGHIYAFHRAYLEQDLPAVRTELVDYSPNAGR